MEKRRFGRTDHFSTVAIFGAAAFWDNTQDQADAAFEYVLSAGVNHIDVAPSYGKAESLLGPWIKTKRDNFFLGCKTMERTKDLAAAEMERSLKRLNTDHFDLYQCHAVTNVDELDSITAKGGALEAITEARAKGQTRFIGITSHGMAAPKVLLEALKRFDFDTILFPLNAVLLADHSYREHALKLIKLANEREVGMMTIKAVARGRWGELPKTHTTWYQPFTETEHIQSAVNFVLSNQITGLCTAGDIQLLPKILSACEQYSKLDEDAYNAQIENSLQFVHEPLFDHQA